MVKRNLMKKIALLGVTALMVMGMATNVMAGSDTGMIELDNIAKSYAYCDVFCDSTYAAADTAAYAGYDATYLYADATVDFCSYHNVTGNEIIKASDSDYGYTSGDVVHASAYASGEYYSSVKANSTHSMYVDGYEGTKCLDAFN